MLKVLHKGFLLFRNTYILPVILWSVCRVSYYMAEGKRDKNDTVCLQSTLDGVVP